MNPRTQMQEHILGMGLSSLFRTLAFCPPMEYPKLIEEIDLDAFRNMVFDIVAEATGIQAEKQEEGSELILFDEALELAARAGLSSVQLLGLNEALRDAGSPLTPELIATYALSKEVVARPARLTFEATPDDEGLDAVRKSALAVLLPEAFDVVAMEGEETDDLVQRACTVLALIAAACQTVKTAVI